MHGGERPGPRAAPRPLLWAVVAVAAVGLWLAAYSQLLVSHTASPATASTPSSGTAELAAWVEAGLRCRDISLPDSDFRVTLCSSAETCRGVVHVHHHQRCSEDLPVSDDPATAAFLKTTCGPDAYEVKLLGPEVIVARPQYAGRCTAVARYELGAEGPHALVVRQLYGDYDAVSEYWDRRRPKWHAHYHRDKRIAQDMADVPCLHPTRDLPPGAARPRCPNASAPGRWVATDRGRWAWRPWRCAYPALAWPPEAAARCLAHRTVTVMGDSQQRSIYYALLNSISPTKIPNNPKAMGGRVDTVGPVTLVYHTDPWLDKPECWAATLNGTRRTDVLLVGYGNWPAAGSIGAQGKWPDARYRRHVLAKAQELRRFRQRFPTVPVYWLGMPAFPHPPIDSRRSNQRLLHMVRSAASAMEAAGIPVIDSFGVAEGMTDTSHDGAHFVNHVTATIAAIALDNVCRDLQRDPSPPPA